MCCLLSDLDVILSELFNEDFDLNGEITEHERFFKNLSEKAKKVDPSLEQFTLAEGAKQLKVLKSISDKIKRAAKQKNEVDINRISNVKERLFPKRMLQERHDNFIPYYLKYGQKWFKELQGFLNPMNKNFLMVEEE